MARRRLRKGVRAEALPEVKMTAIKCAFCDGMGKDPFGALSHLSQCQVCSGRGVVKVAEPIKECLFCGGTGMQPHTPHRLTCASCGGKGWVTTIEPEMAMGCPTCGGSGFTMAPFPVHCLTCKGQGIVRRREPVKEGAK
ncbi:MAG: hypothetical protein QMC90_03145 [Dehalococcoidales bacterium]|nr:hypothetical protein [Dehalococcoidales bacterium]